MEAEMKLQEEIIKRVRNLTDQQQEKILKILTIWQKGKQRDYQRLKTNADVDVLVGDRLIQTRTNDISASGIYIKASEKFELNRSVRIVFSIPGHNKPFKLQGIIIRVDVNGIAIKFENITPYFMNILDDVIWDRGNTEDKSL
jgi:PilZ domain